MTTGALKHLNVLVLDCQTTGSRPGKGQVLEIGWMVLRGVDSAAENSDPVRTFLVKLPEGVAIPPAVSKLTGIDAAACDHAVEPSQAWRALAAQSRRLALTNDLPRCPAVIHFARFETPFLDELHQRWGAHEEFPLDIICTHAIAARLLPGLPRKGLRALAGFLGHSTRILKRCDEHLAASAAIWRDLVPRLEQSEGVATLDDLRQWLARRPKPARAAHAFPMPRAVRLALPDAPGIYCFTRSNGDPLYIGKAGSLKQRVNSYFRAGARHSEKTLEMLTQAARVDIETTASALEAALLESERIKRVRPPYNIALTGDGRQVGFMAPDFSGFAREPDVGHPLGPLLRPDAFKALREVESLLARRRGFRPGPDFHRLLGLPEPCCPEQDCLGAAIDLIACRHADLLRAFGPRAGLMQIGHRLWRETREDSDIQGQDEEGEADREAIEEDRAVRPFARTPQAVAARVEGLARHCGLQIRRARWFVLLSEAVIAWQARPGTTDRLNGLVLRRGRPAERLQIDAPEAIPVPAGPGVRRFEKKRNLDLEAYDGLRVLTTEIRRLLCQRRNVFVRLNRSAPLDSDRLRSLLAWL